jgi:hypothetical protein
MTWTWVPPCRPLRGRVLYFVVVHEVLWSGAGLHKTGLFSSVVKKIILAVI